MYDQFEDIRRRHNQVMGQPNVVVYDIISNKNKTYADMYEKLRSAYLKSTQCERDQSSLYQNLFQYEIDALDFWLEYITSGNLCLPYDINLNIIDMIVELFATIRNDNDNISLKLKYHPENWLDYLRILSNYIRSIDYGFPDSLVMKEKLFTSKEEELRRHGF